MPAGEPPRSHQAGGWNMLPCPDKIKLWSSYWSLFLVWKWYQRNYQTLNLGQLGRKPQEQTSQRKLRLEVFYLWAWMLDVLVDELSDPESFISVIVRILYSILNIDLSNSLHHNGIVVKHVIFTPSPILYTWITPEMKVAVPLKLYTLIALLTRFLSRLLMPYMLLTK